TKSEDFKGALEHAVAANRPFLLDVHVDAEVRPPATGTWHLPPTPYKEPAFGERWLPTEMEPEPATSGRPRTVVHLEPALQQGRKESHGGCRSGALPIPQRRPCRTTRASRSSATSPRWGGRSSPTTSAVRCPNRSSCRRQRLRGTSIIASPCTSPWHAWRCTS